MSATVLVIEDDEMVADVLRINLERAGLSVEHAPSADAGMAAAEQHRPDVVILDLKLTTLGWDVLTRLQSQRATRDLPVIVLASRAMPADQVRAYNLGATAFVTKPYATEDLLARVYQALDDAAAV